MEEGEAKEYRLPGPKVGTRGTRRMNAASLPPCLLEHPRVEVKRLRRLDL